MDTFELELELSKSSISNAVNASGAESVEAEPDFDGGSAITVGNNGVGKV